MIKACGGLLFIAREFVKFKIFSVWINIHPLGGIPDDLFMLLKTYLYLLSFLGSLRENPDRGLDFPE